MRDDDREGFEAPPRREGTPRAPSARRRPDAEKVARRRRRDESRAAPRAARAAPAGENAGPNRPAFESDAKSDGATPVPSDRDEEREEERPKPRRSLLRSRRRARLPFPRARRASFALLRVFVALLLRFFVFRPHSVQEAPEDVLGALSHGVNAERRVVFRAPRARGVRGGGGGAPRRVVRRARAPEPRPQRRRARVRRDAVERHALRRGEARHLRLRHEPSERLLVQTHRHGAFGTKRRLHRAAVAKRGKRRASGDPTRGTRRTPPRAQRRRQHLEPVLRVRDGRGRGGDGTGDKSSEASTAERAAPFVEAPFVVVVVVVSVRVVVAAGSRMALAGSRAAPRFALAAIPSSSRSERPRLGVRVEVPARVRAGRTPSRDPSLCRSRAGSVASARNGRRSPVRDAAARWRLERRSCAEAPSTDAARSARGRRALNASHAASASEWSSSSSARFPAIPPPARLPWETRLATSHLAHAPARASRGGDDGAPPREHHPGAPRARRGPPAASRTRTTPAPRRGRSARRARRTTNTTRDASSAPRSSPPARPSRTRARGTERTPRPRA